MQLLFIIFESIIIKLVKPFFILNFISPKSVTLRSPKRGQIAKRRNINISRRLLVQNQLLALNFEESIEMSGNQCCENPPTLSSSSGVGHVKVFGGLNCYISGSPDSKFSVILISDIFGYEAPNLRKLADKVAAAGFYAIVPDFFRGDPYAPDNVERPLGVWIKEHGCDQGFEDAKLVCAALKSEGITKIAAAGFCWGAKVVVELGKKEYIQAGVLLHPSFVSVEDIQGVKVPISILGAEIDQMSPPELVKQFEIALHAKPEIDCFVKIFPGVSHGWSVRYKDEDELAVKSAEEAHSDMLDWFIKHLK